VEEGPDRRSGQLLSCRQLGRPIVASSQQLTAAIACDLPSDAATYRKAAQLLD